MNRAEFQSLSDERLRDATTLLAAACWSGAYYIAGYSVECALKACILRRIEQTGVIFEEKKFAEKCWTHDLLDLAGLAGIEPARKAAIATDPQLEDNWMMVKDWNESSRYQVWAQIKAELLFNAITDTTSGVLPWIKQYW